MRIVSTNSHVPFLYLLSKIPKIEMLVFSYRFNGRDWQNCYRQKPINILHAPIDERMMIYLIMRSLIDLGINYFVLHSLLDLEIFCNEKNIPKELYKEIQKIPKYFVFHNSIYTDFRGLPQQTWGAKRLELMKIFQENNIKPVCISKWKAEGWQMPCNIILPGIDTTEFPRCWTGINNNYKFNDLFPNYSVRVCSNFEFRDFMNGYNNGNQILSGIKYPNIILGEGNEKTQQKIPQAIFTISGSFENYKQCMAQARVMLSANISQYEDWYNLSSLEAIALGVPMAFATHDRMTLIPEFTKTFPLVSDDVNYLQERINLLFRDESFAQYISQKQIGFTEKYFPISSFLSNWGALLNQEKK